jgi:hypothetical protein
MLILLSPVKNDLGLFCAESYFYRITMIIRINMILCEALDVNQKSGKKEKILHVPRRNDPHAAVTSLYNQLRLNPNQRRCQESVY